jgi:hypothetical protein
MVRCYSNGLTKCKINNSEVKSLPVKSVPFKNAITGNSNSILFPSVNFQTFQSIKSFILCLLLLMAGIGSVNGATITASVSGNWNTQGTWVGNTVPAIGDDVVINSGVIVTVTANAPCKSLTFVAGTGGTLIVNNSFTLTVSNSVTMNIADIANTTSFISGAGSLTCSSVNIGNGTTINYNTTFTQTLTSTISAFTITGNLNLNSTMPRYDTTRNALFIETSGTVTVNGQIVTSNTYGNTSTFKLGDTSPTLYLGGVSPFSISGNGSSLITLSGVNATVNYNMNGAQSVYGINYTHLTLSGSGLKTLQTGTTVIGGNFTLSGTATTVLVTNVTIGGDLYISNGTTLDLAVFSANRSTLGGTLTVAGTMLLGSSSGGQSGSNFPANYASINLTGGTVNYNQSWGSQTIYSAPTYSNLILGNTSNPQTPGGNLTVIGTLTTAAGGSLDMGTYTLSVGNPNNAGIIKTQNISSAPITSSGGTWGGTVIYNGASVQTILTSAFNNLTVDNGSNGALLGGNIVVNGTLTLNGGQLTLGNYNLTMGGSASAVGGFNMMVKNNGTGSFRKIFTVPGSYIFPVADAAGTMSYVTINFASGTFAPNAYASVQVYNTIEPNILNTTTYLNKYWTIAQSGITGFSCTVTGNYNNWSGNGTGDIAGTGTNLYTAEFTGSAWTTSSSLGSPLTATGVTTFGDFTGILQPITVTPASLSGFTYAHGSTPVEQSFTVSGANLSTNLTITPPADYEISTTSGTGYQSTPIILSQSGGNVSTQTIYVRFKVATSVGSFSENISCTSGSFTQNVALSGTVTSSVTYYSIANGNWNANTTWSTTSGGSAVPSGVYPLGGDNVVIERGYTVTVAANAACSSVTISNTHDGNSTLTISGTNSLTVSGAFAMNLPGSTYSYNVNVNAGTLTAGSLTMSATTTTI